MDKGKSTNTLMAALLLVLALSLGGCSGSSGDGTVTRLDSFSKDFLNDVIPYFPDGLNTLNAVYDVNTYRVIYTTNGSDNNEIAASGLLAIPQKGGGASSPVLSFQHGTIFLDAEAPTNSYETRVLLSVLASLGYIVVAPDYLGYGAANATVHPYLHQQTLAASTLDMIRAAEAYLDESSTATNGQLFITGYSEGGYATMAALQSIAVNHSDEFTVTAAVAGAGPYDMSQTASYTLGLSILPDPAYIAYMFKAYDEVYQLNRLSEFFNAPYDTVIDGIFDGYTSKSNINTQLTAATSELFNATFLGDFTGSGETEVKALLAANDVYDWAPNMPIRLFHGVDDDLVPYTNATTAASTLLANAPGADVAVADCVLAPGEANHDNCVVPYVSFMLNYFDGYATNL